MAIEKRSEGRHQYFTLVCDHCGNEAGHFDDFYEAVDEKRRYGFRSIRDQYGDWADICDECYDLAQYRATAAEDFAGLV